MIEPFCNYKVQEYILGSERWSVTRLIELSKDLKVMEIPLDHMYTGNEYQCMKLSEMVSHIKSVNNADLSYPIILSADGDIMDGRHRLMKALLEGAETIKSVRFDETPYPCRIVDN